MLDTLKFGKYLKEIGHDFYTGVPCSWMKNLINYAHNDCAYYNAANEGDAVALASGAYIAGKKPIVLIQSSGLGNTISPLSSLNYIFKIPILIFVSLREGSTTEPQHELMHKISGDIVTSMGMQWTTLEKDYKLASQQIIYANEIMNKTSLPFFIFVEKDTFSDVTLNNNGYTKYNKYSRDYDFSVKTESIKRYDALKSITKISDDTVFLATTGMTGRELYDINDMENNFYMVGSMGCVSAIGLGIAVSSNKKVVVIDGDGAALLRLSAMPLIAQYNPENLCHILLNNGVHDSTGGQTTLSHIMNWTLFSQSMGYESIKVHNLNELEDCLKNWHNHKRLMLIEVPTITGSKSPLGRPNVTPENVKKRLMNFIKQ